MKLNLGYLLKYFRWLAYPVFVGIAAVVMISRMFGDGGLVSRLKEGWSGVEVSRANVEKLRVKVETLKSVGEGEADEELKALLSILPATKQVLPIISGLRAAAVRAGVTLEGYSAVGGEIKGGGSGLSLRVDANVAGNWPAVIQFVEETEKQLPMRRATDVTYAAGKARVAVEGRWAPLADVSDAGGKEVPNFEESLSGAMAAVAGYRVEEAASGSGEPAGGTASSLF